MSAERFVYALSDWTVEKRTSGWYFADRQCGTTKAIGAVPTAQRRVSR